MPADTSPIRTPPGKKLLIIGVDAGSPELLLDWAGRGDLPNVQRLLTTGQLRPVTNPYALEAGAVWPAFHTGLMPGRQPQYDGRRVFVPEDYSERWYGPDETAPTVWRQLSDQGLRCLLIDPPYTPVDPHVNGTTIADWGTHVPADGRRFRLQCHPAETADEVLQLVGPDPAGGVICDRRSPETIDDHKRFRDLYLRRIELKGRLAAHMLRHKPWDVALVASSDLHCTGHHLWHVNDPRHPRYAPRLEAALGEPLRDCYRALDRSLSDVLSAVGADTTVMLFGSHGMGPSFSGTGLLDRILWRLDKGVPSAAPPLRRRLRSRLRDAWHHLPAEARGRLRPLRRQFRGALRPPRFIGRHAGRRFFEVHANNATGGIRFNVRGREGTGLLSPAEADQLAHFLVVEIGKVVNADTGEPLAAEVLVTRDHYHGPHLDRLPDVLVRWNRSAPIQRVWSETIGELRHEYADNRSGDHTPSGLCITAGSGMDPGSLGAAVETVDFAPSFAQFFGLHLADQDGQPFELARRATHRAAAYPSPSR